MEQILRDSRNRIVGSVQVMPNGNMVIRNARNWICGEYIRSSDQVLNERKQFVGHGAALLATTLHD